MNKKVISAYGEYAKGRKSIKTKPILFNIDPLKKKFEPLFLLHVFLLKNTSW